MRIWSGVLRQGRAVPFPCDRLTGCVAADGGIAVYEMIGPAIVVRGSSRQPYAICRGECSRACESIAGGRKEVIAITAGVVHGDHGDRLVVVREGSFPLPEKACRIVRSACCGRKADASDEPGCEGRADPESGPGFEVPGFHNSSC